MSVPLAIVEESKEMHGKLLEGMEITVLGVHPHEKLGGGSITGYLLDIFKTRGARVNLLCFLPYSDKLTVEHEKIDDSVNAVTLLLPSRFPRALKGLLVLLFNFIYTFKYAGASQVVLTSCGSVILNTPAVIASKLRRKPVIYHWLDLEVNPISKFVLKYLIRRTDVVLGLSHYLCQRARDYKCKNVIYAPCFVDTGLFQIDQGARERFRNGWGVKEDDVVLGYAGVLNRPQGVDILIRAFKRLSDRHENIRLVIMGVSRSTGGEWIDVPQLKKDLRLEDNVMIIPPVIHSEVPKVLSACDILCAPKLETVVNSASIPIKVVEYLSMGLPTVTTTAVPELSRVVKDNITGFLAKPGDVESLEAILENIILDYERSLDVGRKGREEVVGEFGIEAVATTIIKSVSAFSNSEHLT